MEAQSREQLATAGRTSGLEGCKLTRVLKGESSFASGEEEGFQLRPWPGSRVHVRSSEECAAREIRDVLRE